MKFYLRTYGCQMNFHDSEILAGMLGRNNWSRVGSEEKADVILLNTCSVRRHAEERVLGKLAEYGRRRGSHSRPVVGVVGCMAQIWGKKLWERFPWLDLIMGPGSFTLLPSVLDLIIASGGRHLEVEFRDREELYRFPAARDRRFRAWVTIMRGCNNFCSYCVVPFSRGREFSRSPENIIREIRELAQLGYREVTLLGQNVNCYRAADREGNTIDFPALLHLIHETEGIERIRFLTSHPRDISPDLIEAVKVLPKVCKQIHFPVQSGSNAILKKMRRGYSREEYREKVLKLREAVGGIAISSDFIVGFPEESEKDFALTLDLIRRVRFDQIFAFSYSPRPKTEAYSFPDDVSEEVKSTRLQEVLAVQRSISEQKNQALLGEVVKVLVEGRNARRPERGEGRTATGKIVFFPWREGQEGRIIPVRLERATDLSLFGRPVG